MNHLSLYRYTLLLVGVILLYFLVNRFQDSWNLSHFAPIPSYPAFPTTNINELVPSSSPIEFADITPTQGSCLSGFYFYENPMYSLCYPQEVAPIKTAQDHLLYDNANGAVEKYYMEFMSRDMKETGIAIIPRFNSEGMNKVNPCETTETISVSGYQAKRTTVKNILPNNTCSDVTEITTGVSLQGNEPFTILYKSIAGQKLIFIDKYKVLDQSLRIKNKDLE